MGGEQVNELLVNLDQSERASLKFSSQKSQSPGHRSSLTEVSIMKLNHEAFPYPVLNSEAGAGATMTIALFNVT